VKNLSALAGNTDVNPYLKQLLADNNALIGNQVNSTMAGMGRFNSGSHADVLARTLAQTDNPILFQAYQDAQNRALGANQALAGVRQNDLNQALAAAGGGANTANAALSAINAGANRALSWAQQMPALQQMFFDPYMRQSQIGNWYQDRAQQELTGQINAYNALQNMDWTQLAKYAGAIQGILPGFSGTGPSSSQSQSQTTTPFGLQQILGLGMAGLGMFGGSDRRMKTDIARVGKSRRTGLPLYAYRYKGDPKTHPKVIGPMAQDIEKKFPGATQRVGGVLAVKPHALHLMGA
jgi:hypothetical protein